jgi:GNAT superfamily N-acetyltransferase
MEPGDVEDVAAFHLRTVLHAYRGIFPTDAPAPSVEQLARDWHDDRSDAWVAVAGDAVVGTVVARGDEVRRLLVAPDRWRSGIGSRLLAVAVEAIRERGGAPAWLWVLEDNARARAFYERHRWSLVPGEVLTHPTGVREVRYRLDLAAASAASS